MAVKTFTIEERSNVLVEVPECQARILIRIDDNRVVITNDKCHHRGGPIHLCFTDSDGERRCPWHGRRLQNEEQSTDFSALYRRSDKRLKLVNNFPIKGPWPIRVISPKSTPHDLKAGRKIQFKQERR